jgi:hypothetical protein
MSAVNRLRSEVGVCSAIWPPSNCPDNSKGPTALGRPRQQADRPPIGLDIIARPKLGAGKVFGAAGPPIGQDWSSVDDARTIVQCLPTIKGSLAIHRWSNVLGLDSPKFVVSRRSFHSGPTAIGQGKLHTSASARELISASRFHPDRRSRPRMMSMRVSAARLRYRSAWCST